MVSYAFITLGRSHVQLLKLVEPIGDADNAGQLCTPPLVQNWLAEQGAHTHTEPLLARWNPALHLHTPETKVLSAGHRHRSGVADPAARAYPSLGHWTGALLPPRQYEDLLHAAH